MIKWSWKDTRNNDLVADTPEIIVNKLLKALRISGTDKEVISLVPTCRIICSTCNNSGKRSNLFASLEILMPGKACSTVKLIPVTCLAIESEMMWTCISAKRHYKFSNISFKIFILSLHDNSKYNL